MTVEQIQGGTAARAAPPSAEESLGARRRRWRRVLMLLAAALLYLLADRALMWVLWRTPAHNLVGRALRDQQYLRMHPEARGMLVIGDSRVKWAIDVPRLAPALGLSPDGGLNVSLPDARIGEDLAVIEWLAKKEMLPDVRAVVWGLGLDRFHAERYGTANVYAFYDPMARGLHLKGWSDGFSRHVAPALLARKSIQALFESERRGEALAQLRIYDFDADYARLGFLPNEEPPDPDPGWGDYFSRQQVVERDAAALERAVRRLREHGLEVVVLDSPVAPKLRSYYLHERVEAWKSYDSLMDRLQEAGAVVIRGHDFAVGPEDFSDAVHLTADAAERYMRWLAPQLVMRDRAAWNGAEE